MTASYEARPLEQGAGGARIHKAGWRSFSWHSAKSQTEVAKGRKAVGLLRSASYGKARGGLT